VPDEKRIGVHYPLRPDALAADQEAESNNHQDPDQGLSDSTSRPSLRGSKLSSHFLRRTTLLRDRVAIATAGRVAWNRDRYQNSACTNLIISLDGTGGQLKTRRYKERHVTSKPPWKNIGLIVGCSRTPRLATSRAVRPFPTGRANVGWFRPSQERL
jgi:hypothetical protein